MAQRRHHGIRKAEFSGDGGGTYTEIENIQADESQLEFPDQEDNPSDLYGNQYGGVQYAEATIQALDLTAYAAIKGNWNADTRQYFRLTLDNGETWTTDYGVLLTQCRPVTVQGRALGRADQFMTGFRIPLDDITKA